MSNEQKLISALETTIETQKQLIKHLTIEIDRLNLTKLVINTPYTIPGSPYPYYAPTIPTVPFTAPINPLVPPFVVTCDSPGMSSGTIILNGGSEGLDNINTTGYVIPSTGE